MILTKEKLNILKASLSNHKIEFDKNKYYLHDVNSGVEANCGIIGDTFVIVFHATDSKFVDWLTNFLYFFKKMPYINSKKSKVRIHSGYANGYMAIRDALKTQFFLSKKKMLFVCGYSQGGGLAPICALDFQYNFDLDYIEVLVGEPPRVFNKAGKISYEKRVPNTLRLDYGNDIVPKVPPILFGFRHIGKLLHFGPERKWWKISFTDHNPKKGLYEEVEKYINDNN